EKLKPVVHDVPPVLASVPSVASALAGPELPPVLPAEPRPVEATEPQRTPEAPPASAPPAGGVRTLPPIKWERFLGVKLFAWVGGLALFLGVAFFVKYSFEQNLISAQMRVAIGYAVGAGLLGAGLWMPRERQVVTVQTLCATGILVLYATSFAAH